MSKSASRFRAVFAIPVLLLLTVLSVLLGAIDPASSATTYTRTAVHTFAGSGYTMGVAQATNGDLIMGEILPASGNSRLVRLSNGAVTSLLEFESGSGAQIYDVKINKNGQYVVAVFYPTKGELYEVSPQGVAKKIYSPGVLRTLLAVDVDTDGGYVVYESDFQGAYQALVKLGGDGSVKRTYTLPRDSRGNGRVAVDADGNYLVTQGGDSSGSTYARLLKVNRTTGVITVAYEFDKTALPIGLALTAQGDCVVVEHRAATLVKVTKSGQREVLYQFATGTYPFGVTIDSAGTYLVAEYSTRTVSRIAPASTTTTAATTTTTAAATTTTAAATTTTKPPTTTTTKPTTTSTTAAPTTTTTSVISTPAAFPDVPANHPYFAAISGMAAQQIIGGFSSGNFGPADPVTRQQFAKMIVLTLGLAVSESDFPDPGVPFVDLGADDPGKLYPHEYVAVCAMSNITKGTDASHFNPAASITRQQMITMVVRAADRLVAGALSAVPAGWSGVLSYGDATHGPNVKKAEYNGLLAGIRAWASAAGLAGWDTSAKASRGEVAQMLWNLRPLVGGSGRVDCGNAFNLALKSDGSLWAWGFNATMQLGDGTKQERHEPIRVGSDVDWKMVSAGSAHSLAVKSDGTLWAWGYNGKGQLGDGTTIDRYEPTRIGSDSDWKSVSAGELHSLGVKSDGTLWAWGFNSNGRLGDGTTQDRLEPVQIGTDSDWKTVEAGWTHSLAIKADGSLWAWGYNGNGRLGDGTKDERHQPVRIGTDSDWAMVTSSWGHALAIKTNGSLWAWGYNGSGRLGDGTTQDRLKPVRIGSDTNWRIVAAGDIHSVAVKTDGSLWAWGANANGRLGDGTTQDRLAPTRIGADLDWKTVTAGQAHTVAIKTNGSLWAWGANANGRLGDGGTQDRHVPTLISGF